MYYTLILLPILLFPATVYASTQSTGGEGNSTDNDRTLDIFGFELIPPTLNPEMSYADIAGVVALFFTLFTLMFSIWQWSKRRKSEQVQIASESMDRIRLKTRNAFDAFRKLITLDQETQLRPELRVKELESKLSQFRDQIIDAEAKDDRAITNEIFLTVEFKIDTFNESFRQKFADVGVRVIELMEDYEYLTYLVKNHEIEDKSTIAYHGGRLKKLMSGQHSIIQDIRQSIEKEKLLFTQSEILKKVTRTLDINKSVYESVYEESLEDWNDIEARFAKTHNYWLNRIDVAAN